MSEISSSPGYVQRWKRQWSDLGWWHSFELPDGSFIRGVNHVDVLRARVAAFPIPQNLSGKRVLDIGAWDGWFSFEMERRGAEVLAIDVWDNPRFHEIRRILNSKVEYRQLDVYDLSPATTGCFDIVLFMGVLYHLKHPLLALEKVCSVTTELAAVDSYILADDLDPKARPVLEFYETDEFEGQTDNWVAPNLACLLAMCRTAGFARVELKHIQQYGAAVACFRRWEPGIRPDTLAPRLASAVHNINGGINFQSAGDDYLTGYFEATNEDLQLDEIQPQVGKFGVRPIHAKRLEEATWQINFKLPPGLPPGWTDVSVRIRNGAPSNTRQIAIDLPVPTSAPIIQAVCDGATWQKGQLDISSGDVLSMWIAGLPRNADTNNLRVTLNGQPCVVLFVADAEAGEARQVNVRVPPNVSPGPATVSLHLRDQPETEPAHIDVVRD